eukprot:symbB.v1.2.015773.t1/scaffold1181.1/size133410/9
MPPQRAWEEVEDSARTNPVTQEGSAVVSNEASEAAEPSVAPASEAPAAPAAPPEHARGGAVVSNEASEAAEPSVAPASEAPAAPAAPQEPATGSAVVSNEASEAAEPSVAPASEAPAAPAAPQEPATGARETSTAGTVPPVATPRKSRDEGVDVAVSNVAPTTTPQKATGSPTLPPIDAGNSQAPKAAESKAQTVLPPIQNQPSDKDQVDVPAAEAGDAHTFTVADALVEHAQEAATLENQADKVQKEPDPSEQPQSREKEVVQTTEVPKEDLQESSTSQDGQRPPEESDEPQEAEVVGEPVIIPPQEKAGPSSPRKKMDMRRRMNNTTTGPGSFGTARRLSAHPATASGIHQALIMHPSDFDVAKDSSRGSKAQRPNTEKGIDFWSSDPLPSPGRGVPGTQMGGTKPFSDIFT